MSNKTAVQLILDKFNLLSDNDFKSWMLNYHDELIQMERERIIHANTQGRLYNSNGESWKVEDAEYEANEWYVKTYGGQDEQQ